MGGRQGTTLYINMCIQQHLVYVASVSYKTVQTGILADNYKLWTCPLATTRQNFSSAPYDSAEGQKARVHI